MNTSLPSQAACAGLPQDTQASHDRPGISPSGPDEAPSKRRLDALVHKADFERVLATRWRSRSTHFALHHVHGGPLPRVWVAKATRHTELSTTPAPVCPQPVDEYSEGLWFACVVPKRHARRAVTRNLIKRQIRSAFQRLGQRLPAGLWLVRLRAPFVVTDFVSARSAKLAAAVREELDVLLGRALA